MTADDALTLAVLSIGSALMFSTTFQSRFMFSALIYLLLYTTVWILALWLALT